MARKKRRKFSPEFMAEAVELCRVGDRSITQVATDLDLTESALRRWVRRDDEAKTSAAARSTSSDLSSSERSELQRLRKENARLQMEREILKKAAAFFAKESS